MTLAGDEAAPAARVKSRLALAGLWLTLGCSAAAAALLDDMPPPPVPGMAMQWHWLRARLAEQNGQSPRHCLMALARLDQAHPDLPLVHSAHFEASYVGDAAVTIARLTDVHRQCEERRLWGTAHSMRWRALVRRLECTDASAIDDLLSMAAALQPHVERGMSAKSPVHQVWVTLAGVYQRSGETSQQRRCMDAARAWVENALKTVPPQYRDNSARAHRLDRIVLQPWSAGPPGGP